MKNSIIRIIELIQENFTSGDKTKFGGAENGHEFEPRTITEKST